MNTLEPEPSDHSFLRSLDSLDSAGESKRLVSAEFSHKDVPNDQNQEAINKPRSETGQNNENSILLPPEVEMLTKEDPEGRIGQQLIVILDRQGLRWILISLAFCISMFWCLLLLQLVWDDQISMLSVIFMWCFTFLSSLLIGNIIQFKTPEIFPWRKIETMCTIIDIAILLLTILGAYFRVFFHFEFPVKIILAPLVANFFFYLLKSKAPKKEKIIPIVFRVSYVIIFSIIIFKLSGDLDVDWTTVIFFACVPLSFVSIYCIVTAITFILRTCSSLYLYFIERNRERTSENFDAALGYLWLCLCSSNAIHLLVFMMLKMESPQSLLNYLIFTRNFNIAFVLFTLLILKRLRMFFVMQSSDAESYFNELQKNFSPDISTLSKVQISLELIRLSPTYFTSNKDNENNEIKQDTNNEYLCDICCRGVADAVMARCGHGGICVDCAIALITSRRDCKECRQRVEAILKINLSSAKEDTVKAVEAIIIHGKPGNTNIYEIV